MGARLYAVGPGGVLQAVRLALLGARLGLLAARLTLLEARLVLQGPAVGAETGCGWCCRRARFRGAVGAVGAVGAEVGLRGGGGGGFQRPRRVEIVEAEPDVDLGAATGGGVRGKGARTRGQRRPRQRQARQPAAAS